MTNPNPLMNLFVQEKTPPAFQNRPVEAAEPKDPSMEENILRGFLERYSQQGEVNIPSFDDMFRTSVSPARNMLANMFYGMSAGLSGQQLKTLRQRKFEEYQVEVRNRQIEQQRRDQMAQYAFQAVTRFQEQQRDQQFKSRIENAALLQDDQNRNLELTKLWMQNRDYFTKLQQDQWKQYYGDVADNYLQDALVETAMKYKANGADPMDPKTQVAIRNEAWNLRMKRMEDDLKAKEEHTTSAETTPRLFTYKTIHGDLIKAINPRTGEEVWNSLGLPADFQPREVSPSDNTEIAFLDKAMDNLDGVLGMIQSNPGIVGEKIQKLPFEVRNFFGITDKDEITVQQWLNSSMLDYIVSKSGKQLTDAERDFIIDVMPKFYQTPEEFTMATLAFKSMLQSAKVRTQLGPGADKLDFRGVINDYLMGVREDINSGTALSNIVQLTIDDIINEAGARAGVTFIRDRYGRIHGVE